MKKIINIIIALVLCFSSSLINMKTVNGEENVRVGVFNLGNFQAIDENGEASGYNIEYLNHIAEYNHLRFEYVEVTNWADGLKKLDENKIDLIAPAQMTEERSAKYNFSAYSMSTEYGAIYTLKDADCIYEDMTTMKTLHYGAAINSPITTNFTDSYCVGNDITPNITYYEDTTALFQALYDGAVDAIATNIMLDNNKVKMIGRFSPRPVYYITQKENSALMSKLDEAMTEIRIVNPTYEAQLMSKYFASFSNTAYTYEELEYINAHNKIKIGYQTDNEPLSYTNKKGQFAGITRDILDMIAKKSGLSFEYVALPATDVTYDYLKKNKIHVLSNVEYNDLNNNIAGMKLSSPFLSSDKVLVAKTNVKLDIKSELSIALATGSQTLAATIKETYLNFKTNNYDSVEAAFSSVLSDKEDGTIVNRHVAETMLTKPKYYDLEVIPIQNLSDELCLATLNYSSNTTEEAIINNGPFLSIVDKTIKQISSKDINSIIISNTTKSRYDTTFFDFLYQYRYFVITFLILVAACIFFLLRVRKIENKKNIELEEKNRQLAEAVCQAKRANDAKSQFLSTMSHEVRTPMNAIVGITEIAKHHKDDASKIDDYLTKIESSSRVLLNIINDVLDMSAIESEKLKIANNEFDIKQVLNEISTVYYPQCEAKGIEFIMNTNIENEILVGDSLRINQILLNLISNAYKFTDAPGKISVSVEQEVTCENQVYLRFKVQDSGIGMSLEMQKRLFRPFEQESAMTAKKHGGSGLGLSIAKNLIDMMHGAIKVESTEGVGTTFTVDIPFGLGEKQELMTSDKLKNIQALVVDDDSAAREYTSIVLERIGIGYDVCSSGVDAIEKARGKHEQGSGYDICLIDWKMPGMSGIEVTRQLRKYFDHDTLIIIVSAYDLSEVEDEAKSAGADYFVTKPIFQSTVFNVLMTLSGGKYTQETADINDYDFTGYRVLLAEDNALNAEIATELLEMVNMEVEHAENGAVAVEKFQKAPVGTYDAILMDIQMPVLDGYQATAKIRETDPTIPILAMTANAFSQDVSASLNAGMDGHIAKPIDTEVLYSTLKKTIEDK